MASDFLRSAPDGKIRDVKAYLRERMPSVKFGFLQERVTRARLDWPDLVAATALYEELLAADFEFHDIAPRGLYFRLRGAGAVDPCLFGERETKKAMRIPPEGTRARPRSDAIQEAASDSKATANWVQVTTAERRLNLADPQATSGQWQSLATKGGKS